MRNEEDIWEDQAYQNGSSFNKRLRTNSKNNITNKFSPNLKAIVGICHACTHYEYAINDVHQLILSYCTRFNKELGKNGIKDCSGFMKRQTMSLTYMFSIATYIETSQKDTPGFLAKKKN